MSSNCTPQAKDGRIGESLAKLRLRNGWTLEKVSDITGLAVSTLSKIENGHNAASFDTIMKLSTTLGMSFEQLIKPEGTDFASGMRAVTPLHRGVRFSTEQYAYEVHASDLSRKHMVPLLITVKARAIGAFDDWSCHAGEEFVLVIDGAIEMHSDVYAPLRLTKGESVYFSGTMRHAFISVDGGDATIMSVCMGDNRPLSQRTRNVDGVVVSRRLTSEEARSA